MIPWQHLNGNIMISFDEERMLDRIQSETGQDREYAEMLVGPLRGLDHRLQEPVDQWLAGADARAFSYEGVRLGTIMLYLQTDFIGGFHFMNALMDGTEELESFKEDIAGPIFVDDCLSPYDV